MEIKEITNWRPSLFSILQNEFPHLTAIVLQKTISEETFTI